jgi:hypothetical protein
MKILIGRFLGFGTRREHNNLILLVSLLLMIVFLPLFDKAAWLFDVVLAVILVSCIRSVSINQKAAIVAWSLAALPLMSLALYNLLPEWLNAVARSMTLPFFIYTVAVLLRELMRARDVELSELYGAASTYLLIGLTWGVVYILVEFTLPGSFSFPDHDPGTHESLIYFSYVTLVTLGYGEITPIIVMTRSFSITEAIMGNLFLTILVARLVGIYTSRQTKRAE